MVLASVLEYAKPAFEKFAQHFDTRDSNLESSVQLFTRAIKLDVESSPHVWGLTPSGKAGASWIAKFSTLDQLLADQVYQPTFESSGSGLVNPPASFLHESSTCTNVVDRASFLSAWSARNSANFFEVELTELYPTPKVAYRVFKSGVQVAEYVMVDGYPETVADDGTAIANPIDYTLQMVLGTAYSKREVFVECLTGD